MEYQPWNVALRIRSRQLRRNPPCNRAAINPRPARPSAMAAHRRLAADIQGCLRRLKDPTLLGIAGINLHAFTLRFERRLRLLRTC